MAGIVHEVENADLLARVRQESAAAARQLAEAARLHKGQIVVVGCSTSEVVGHQVGSWSTPEVADAIFRGLNSVFAPMGVYMAEPIADTIAVTFTAIIFAIQFRKALRLIEGTKKAAA